MCGIAGIVALREHAASPAREQLVDMAGALRHRGPDEFGIYRDERAGLAHARLSIIDLASGQQPMSNEDGAWWVPASYGGTAPTLTEAARLDAVERRRRAERAGR